MPTPEAWYIEGKRILDRERRRESVIDYFRRMAPIWRRAGVTEIFVSPAVERELREGDVK